MTSDNSAYWCPQGYRLCLLHVYLHREPHGSGTFDMLLVYEDMPQESGSYQCKRICKRIRDRETNMAVNMGDNSV
jgi:hypothetical protein